MRSWGYSIGCLGYVDIVYSVSSFMGVFRVVLTGSCIKYTYISTMVHLFVISNLIRTGLIHQLSMERQPQSTK